VAEADYKAFPLAPGHQLKVSAARVRYEYEVDGKPAQEDVFVVVEAELNSRIGLINWNVSHVSAVRAPAGKMDDLRVIGQTIQSSIRANPKWYNRLLQFVEIRSHEEVTKVNQIGARARILSKLNDEVSEARKRMYEGQQKAAEDQSRQRALTMREVTPYDTGDGRTVEIPNAYDHVWRGRDGQYILTTDPRYDPNADLNVSSNNSFTRLEKTR
jgi:hypothetical protein